MCILPLSETLLQKLDGFNSPVVVDVKSSVIFEVCFHVCQLRFILVRAFIGMCFHAHARSRCDRRVPWQKFRVYCYGLLKVLN